MNHKANNSEKIKTINSNVKIIQIVKLYKIKDMMSIQCLINLKIFYLIN